LFSPSNSPLNIQKKDPKAAKSNKKKDKGDFTSNLRRIQEERHEKEKQRDSTCVMGWLQLVGSMKLYVSFAKETFMRDDILPKRPII